MIEMLSFLIRSSITVFSYGMSCIDVCFENGTFRYLRDEINRGLSYYFKDEIKYI